MMTNGPAYNTGAGGRLRACQVCGETRDDTIHAAIGGFGMITRRAPHTVSVVDGGEFPLYPYAPVMIFRCPPIESICDSCCRWAFRYLATLWQSGTAVWLWPELPEPWYSIARAKGLDI